jgi:hypothetical protein
MLIGPKWATALDMAVEMEVSEEMSPVTVKMLALGSLEEVGAGRRSWAVTLQPAAEGCGC